MKDNFDQALKHTLQYEGGWSKHPADPGGATMKGVTKRVYEEFLGHDVTDEQLREIPDTHVEAIYRKLYWDRVMGDRLPAGLDAAVFDFAVNSGGSRAARHLQALVGATVDGKIGPITLAAAHRYVDQHGARDAIVRLNEGRLEFLRKLPTWKVFGRGWQRRVDALTSAALKLTGVPAWR